MNKTKHIDRQKACWSHKKNIAQISEKKYDFLLGRIYLTGNNGYQSFLVFASMVRPLKLDSNRKATNWISSRISSEKIETIW